jgi:hypothetical protein
VKSAMTTVAPAAYAAYSRSQARSRVVISIWAGSATTTGGKGWALWWSMRPPFLEQLAAAASFDPGIATEHPDNHMILPATTAA